MALIVQKYGGTSVGSAERIKSVAGRVAKFAAAGHQLIVVVSAMSGETNRLVALAKEIQADPDPREFDVVLSTGEQVTIERFLPLSALPPGKYTLEVNAKDVHSNQTISRTADFTVKAPQESKATASIAPGR